MTKLKQDAQKKVLDVLKEKLTPLTDGEGETLAGGFSSQVPDADSIDPTLNGSCGQNKPCNTTNNSCGGTKPPTSN